MSNVVLWLHVLAAATWFGTNVVQAVAPPLMARGGAGATATWYRAASDFGTRIYTPAALILLFTGVELVRSGPWSFASTFVMMGIGMVLVGATLGIFVFGPGGRATATAVESGDASASASAITRLRAFGILDSVLLLLTIYAMLTKLGA